MVFIKQEMGSILHHIVQAQMQEIIALVEIFNHPKANLKVDHSSRKAK